MANTRAKEMRRMGELSSLHWVSAQVPIFWALTAPSRIEKQDRWWACAFHGAEALPKNQEKN